MESDALAILTKGKALENSPFETHELLGCITSADMTVRPKSKYQMHAAVDLTVSFDEEQILALAESRHEEVYRLLETLHSYINGRFACQLLENEITARQKSSGITPQEALDEIARQAPNSNRILPGSTFVRIGERGVEMKRLIEIEPQIRQMISSSEIEDVASKAKYEQGRKIFDDAVGSAFKAGWRPLELINTTGINSESMTTTFDSRYFPHRERVVSQLAQPTPILEGSQIIEHEACPKPRRIE